MDDTEQVSALRTEVIKLITFQESVFSNWIKFMITIQGGLAAGFGFVINLTAHRPLRFLFVLLLASFGIATALFFQKILARHAQWSAWYVRKCNNLTATSSIFPSENGEIDKMPQGPVSKAVADFLRLVAVGWGLILLGYAVMLLLGWA